MRTLLKWFVITIILLVHTNSQSLGCIVAMNSTGLAIVLKTASEESLPKVITNDCQQAYLKNTALTLACQNNTCSFDH